ncbi:MAG: phosphomannose isomerase type II C-terminal cupin domain [Candidatus Paceibacterota bacterium]|jgi:mannose-1-phosphate guanylyltransferase/mannose-1-phosphate guanylyltransferase/mannose-6-phosphate isomerase
MIDESPKPYREERPWGEFVKFTENSQSTVKIITVKAGEATSLQFHHGRSEFWHIISGEGSVDIDGTNYEASAGKDFFIPKEITHRISGGQTPLVLLEIAFGNFNEQDIERIIDNYGRIKSA